MVHAGGRGKGRFQGVATQEELEKVVQGIPVEGGVGGVALCKSIDDVRTAAEAMLGNVLVTKQTGLDGVKVNTIFVTVGADIEREIYAAVLLDRQESQDCLDVLIGRWNRDRRSGRRESRCHFESLC